MIRLVVGVLLGVLLLLAGCGGPTDQRVKAAFEQGNPGAEVVFVGPGEGDGSSVYYHIKYRRPGDDQVHEDVWQYVKQRDGSWAVTHKDAGR